MAVWPGTPYVINTAYDVFEILSAGVTWQNANTGSYVKGYEILPAPTIPPTSGVSWDNKFGVIGDIELMAVPPLELGNRVWNDANANGVQDPAEAPIANVAIELYADFNNDGMPDSGTPLATTSTASNGTWYFNSTNVADGDPSKSGLQSGPQPNKRYLIRIGSTDWTAGAGTGDLAGLLLTTSNFGDGTLQPDVHDNDATLVSSIPTISYLVGNRGESNHTLDIGFRMASCALTDAGATLEACNNNGTASNGADDYITFSLNPAGTNLGGTYSVSVNNSGTLTNLTNGLLTGISYGSAMSFRLQNGSANGTVYTITVTDVSGAACVVTTTVQQNACVSCVPPALTIVSGTVCAGSSINLATLVTGNAPAGTLTFHTSQADATAGTNALVNTTVAPMATTTYYVRSSLSSDCYTTAALSVTVSTVPALTVMDGTVCPGGSINLASLMTGSGIGTLSYYGSLSDAQSGTGMLPPPGQVSPVSAKNYYVRSTNSSGCFSIAEITVTIKPAVCAQPTVTGPN